MRKVVKTPRGYVRLHRVNANPGNLGFTIPISISRQMTDAEGALFRPVLLPEGLLFLRVPEHSNPKEDPDASPQV